jgi:hypothetical protein
VLVAANGIRSTVCALRSVYACSGAGGRRNTERRIEHVSSAHEQPTQLRKMTFSMLCCISQTVRVCVDLAKRRADASRHLLALKTSQRKLNATD